MNINKCILFVKEMKKCRLGEEEKLRVNVVGLIDEIWGVGSARVSGINNQDLIIVVVKKGIYFRIELKCDNNHGKHLLQILGYIRDEESSSDVYGKWNQEALTITFVDQELLKYLQEIGPEAPNELPGKHRELCKKVGRDSKIPSQVLLMVDEKKFIKDMISMIEGKCLMKIRKTTTDTIIDDYRLLELCFPSRYKKEDEKINFFFKFLLNGAIIDRDTMFGYCDEKQYEMTNYIFPFLNTVESGTYTDDEIRKLLMYKPKLMDPSIREALGAYYTKQPLANLGDLLNCERISPDWKIKYRVRDLGSAYGNLTVGRDFVDLTLIDIVEEAMSFVKKYNINPGCDTLTTDILRHPRIKNDSKKPSVNIMNPPQVQQGSKLSEKSEHKEDITKTRTADEMKEKGLAQATFDYFYQFIYEAIMIDNNVSESHICVYANLKFLTSIRGKLILNLLSKYRYFFNGGFVFNAAMFDDVGNWAMCYLIFSRIPDRDKKEEANIKSFELRVVDEDKTGKLYFTEQIYLVYSYDENQDLGAYCKSIINKNRKKYQRKELEKVVNLHSALNPREAVSSVPKGFLGEIWFDLDHSAAIFSSAFENRSIITLENLDNIILLFLAAVKQIKLKTFLKNGVNIVLPTITKNNEEKLRKIIKDGYVYSIFSEHSKQSSMRGIKIDGEIYDIKNQWFYDSKNNIYASASSIYNGHVSYQEQVDDCNNDQSKEDRILYTKLEENKSFISNDALEVLELGREINIEFTKFKPFVPILLLRSRGSKEPQPFSSHNKSWDGSWYQTRNSILQVTYRKDEKGFEELSPIIEKLKRHNNLTEKLGNKLIDEIEELELLRNSK